MSIPESAARIELVRRVYGIETELSTPSLVSHHGEIFEHSTLLPGLTRVRSFLSNGARLYKDVGDHLEYAAPEAQSIREAIAGVIAGEILLTKITDRARPNMGQDESIGDTSLNMRVIDDRGVTWGSHENYMTRRDISPKDATYYNPIASFLATRSLFSGVGYIPDPQRPNTFRIAQKIWGISEVVADGTTGTSKPLVNTRDQPLADKQVYRRLHLTAGDSTQSPWASAFRLGSTSLVIRMLEHGVDLRDFVFSNPIMAARTAAELTQFRTPLEMVKGGSMTPLEHQSALAELAMEFIDVVEVPEEERLIALEWHKAAKDLTESGDVRVLGDRVDWAAKIDLISHRLSRTNGKRELAPRAIDILYGELSCRGLAMKLRSANMFRDPLNVGELVADFIINPPEGRAWLRGSMITRLAKLRKLKLCDDVSAEWEIGSWTRRSSQRTIRLNNPFGENEDELAKVKERFAEIDNLLAA